VEVKDDWATELFIDEDSDGAVFEVIGEKTGVEDKFGTATVIHQTNKILQSGENSKPLKS